MFAVIHLPNFSLQAVLRNEPGLDGQPVAITNDTVIFQANQTAAGFGVVAGITASQAQARCHHLRIKPRSLFQEATATNILLQTAYCFSPRIEDTDAGVCTLELKGLGLEDATACNTWAAGILKMLAAFHLNACIGFAVAPALARLAAQVAKPVSVVQDVGEFVATLPIEMLEPSPNTLKILRLWGIETAGALMGLGKDCVLERLGEESIELFESVSTTSVRPLRLVMPPEIFTEAMMFESEIETLEPLLNILSGFVQQLTQRLSVIHYVAGEWKLELGLTSGEKIQRCFKMPAPTNDNKVLLRTLRTYLETLKTGSPTISLSLTITSDKPRNHQFGLFETTLRNPNQFFETLSRLNALHGIGRVGMPVVEPTHKPDTFRMESPCFDVPGKGVELTDQNDFVPLRRFRPAVSAVIQFVRQKPVMIRSRVCSGPITNTAGPYLSSGDWWDEHRWCREEWDIQVANRIHCRIVRSNQGDFVEGVYD